MEDSIALKSPPTDIQGLAIPLLRILAFALFAALWFLCVVVGIVVTEEVSGLDLIEDLSGTGGDVLATLVLYAPPLVFAAFNIDTKSLVDQLRLGEITSPGFIVSALVGLLLLFILFVLHVHIFDLDTGRVALNDGWILESAHIVTIILTACIIAPIFFFGYLLSSLTKRIGIWAASILIIFLYPLVELLDFQFAWAVVMALLAMASIIFRAKYPSSLLPVIICHLTICVGAWLYDIQTVLTAG